MNETFTLILTSPNVQVETNQVKVVSLGEGTLTKDHQQHLKATIRAAVTTYASIDYRISVAIFDKHNKLLGAATNVVSV